MPVPPAYFYAAIQKNYAEAMPFTESNPLAGQRLERSIKVSAGRPRRRGLKNTAAPPVLQLVIPEAACV